MREDAYANPLTYPSTSSRLGIAICGKTAINPALTLRTIVVAQGLIGRRCLTRSRRAVCQRQRVGVEAEREPVGVKRGVSARVGLRHRSKGGIKGEE
jgi:hypothetical protein